MRALLRLCVLLCTGTGLAAQAGTIRVPANIKAEGLPPISATLVEKLKPYAQFSRTTLANWHPTKNEMLVTSLATGTPQIQVVSTPATPPQPLAGGLAGVTPSYGWLSNDFFTYRRDAGGAEQYQIYRLDVTTAKQTMLTDGKSRNGIPVWSRRTHRIAYASNRRNGKDWDIYVMDVLNPQSARMLFEASGVWSAADWSPDDTQLLVIESLPGNDTALWSVDVETGARTALVDGTRATWRVPHYSPDGKSIYAVSNRDSELARVWKYSAGKWTPLTRDGDSVETAALSTDGKLLAVVFDRDASSRLELLDAANGKVKKTPALAAGIISGLRWNRAGNAVGFSLNTLRTASDAFSVDAGSGRVTRWTESSIGGLDTSAIPDPQIVRWKSFDGKTISGVLYQPPSKFKGPRPVMINIHGGPSDAYERPRFQGRSGYFLNELGVAIIFPNVRGSFGFGKTYEKLDDQRNREDAVRDIGALLDWIGKQRTLDPKRVMVTGVSYGGYMTYAVAAKYPSRIRAAYAGAAISDFATFLKTTEPSRVENRRSEYGDERDADMKAFLGSISPLNYAEKIQVPLMIAHGRKDVRVPVGQAEAIAAAVKLHNPNVWLVIYEDEGHENFLLAGANSQFHFHTWIAFMEKFLLN